MKRVKGDSVKRPAVIAMVHNYEIDSQVLNVLLDSIFRLPEVDAVYAETPVYSNGKHRLLMRANPDSSNPGDYAIDVGYNSQFRFETRLSFMVNIYAKSIRINDRDSGIVSLATYRQLHKKKP